MKGTKCARPPRRLCSALLLALLCNNGASNAFSLSSTKIRSPNLLPSCKIIPTTSTARNFPVKLSTISLAAMSDDGISSSSSDALRADDDKHQLHNLQRQSSSPFLSLGYSLAAIMNVAAAMSLIWGSCTSKRSISSSAAATSFQLISSNHHYWDPAFTSATLSYLLLGAGTCQLLSKITKQSVQEEDQIKLRQRLTIGTLLFSTISMLSFPGEAGYHLLINQEVKFATSLLLCQLSKLVTAATSFIGWEGTISGGFGSSFSSRLKSILREVMNGVKSTSRSLPISDAHPASFYRTFFIFVMLGNVAFNVPNLVFYLKEGVNWFSLPVSTIISSIGRGCLLSTILFVLKEEHASRSSADVINEGRTKEKKTKGSEESIVLNMMVGLWAVGGEFGVTPTLS